MIVAAVSAAILVTAAPAGAGSPTATAAGEELVIYLPRGKIKLSKRIAYQAVCSADCQLTATSTLVLRGPDLGPVSVAGSFAAFQIAEPFLRLNKAARTLIKDNLGASKLNTSITATNVTTGEVDTDRRSFKFKR